MGFLVLEIGPERLDPLSSSMLEGFDISDSSTILVFCILAWLTRRMDGFDCLLG